MIYYDPMILSLGVVQDSSPGDGLMVSYMPSIFNDSAAAVAQISDYASANGNMQEQWRAVAENMQNQGIIYSESI